VAKAAPDGYTVLIASPSSILVNRCSTRTRLPAAARPRAGQQSKRVASVVAVNPNIGVSSLRELIDHAKKNPGKLNFATSGNGAAPHLAAVLFQRLAGVEMVHVPYKGGGPAVQSCSRRDAALVRHAAVVLPLVNAGRLRALASRAASARPWCPECRAWRKPACRIMRFPSGTVSSFRRHAGRDREAPVHATGGVLQNAEVNRALAKKGPRLQAPDRRRTSRLSWPRIHCSGRAW